MRGPYLPRTLGKRLTDAGLEVTGVSSFPLINLTPSPGAYSAGMRDILLAYVRRHGDIAEADLTAWSEEQDRLSAEGRYFFSSARTIFTVRRPD